MILFDINYKLQTLSFILHCVRKRFTFYVKIHQIQLPSTGLYPQNKKQFQKTIYFIAKSYA